MSKASTMTIESLDAAFFDPAGQLVSSIRVVPPPPA
jgi:hypothetical protein